VLKEKRTKGGRGRKRGEKAVLFPLELRSTPKEKRRGGKNRSPLPLSIPPERGKIGAPTSLNNTPPPGKGKRFTSSHFATINAYSNKKRREENKPLRRKRKKGGGGEVQVPSFATGGGGKKKPANFYLTPLCISRPSLGKKGGGKIHVCGTHIIATVVFGPQKKRRRGEPSLFDIFLSKGGGRKGEIP